MITIIYIVSTLELAGPTHQLYNIVKYLDKNNFKPIIITLSPEPLNSLKEKFRTLDIPIISLNLNRINSIFLAKFRIKKIIEKYKPGIIHTNGLRPDRLTLKLKNYNYVSTIRGDYSINYPSKYGKIGFLMAKLHLYTIRKINIPIACSESIANEFEKKYNIKLLYIRNGVDTDHFFPIKNKFITRKNLALPEKKIIFITVGSVDYRKNIETIIKSFTNNEILNKSLLLILGHGPQINELQEKAKNIPQIIFLGEVNNTAEYLRASDYFISASLSEGLPNAVLEALACGLPVILSDIPPHREILDLDPNTGVIFEKKNSFDLAEKINLLIKKNYKQLSISASSLIKNNLSAEKMSVKYQQLYYTIFK